MIKWRFELAVKWAILLKLGVWIMALSLPLPTYSQNKPLTPFYFQYLTTDHGLSQNTVDFIYKDSYGFMWFATLNGLCRYDGHEFNVFKVGSDSLGLPNNFVHALVEDRDRLLWIGTGKGLSVFDLKYERFCRLDWDTPGYKSLAIKVFFKDQDGNIIVGTENSGLFQLSTKKYDPESNSIQFSLKRLGLQDVTVEAIIQLDDRNLLIGTSHGLWRYDNKEKIINAVSDIPLSENTSPEILSLFFDRKNGDIWIGTQAGLLKYNIWNGESKVFLHDPEDPSSLAHNTVNAICKDVQGNILLGTLEGLNIYQPESGELHHIFENADHHNGLNNRFVNSIFADQFANVWVGTDKGGVNKYNVFQNKFGAIVHDKGDPFSMSHPTVNSILVGKKWLWVGTAGGGLNMIDADNHKTIRRFRLNPNDQQSLSSDFVTSILRDRKGQLWVGTWGSGLNRLLSSEQGRFQRYLAGDYMKAPLSNNFVSSIFEDPGGYILIGTNDGLNIFDPQEGQFEEIQLKDADEQGNLEVGCIWLDRTDHYWIGTRKGLYRFPAKGIRQGKDDLQTGDIQYFSAFDQLKKNLPGNYIISLKEDDQGRLWIGTYGNGIAYCQLEGEQALQFKNYDEKDGLCNNVVYCIEIDQSGVLWLSTDFGLSRFNPETETFKNYFEVDGLLDNQFYWSASCKDSQGLLYFGGVEGLNFFDPARMEDFPFIPKASLTDISVLNKPLSIGEKRHGKVALRKSITEAESIFLSYKDNVFSIEFSTLDYFLPNKVEFSYKMEGFDQDWVTVPSSRNYASYMNLSGGEYTFKVKASNGNGQWQEDPVELRVVIRPPFWDTNWFRFLSLAVLVFLIIGYIRWRTRYLNLQKKRLEKLVNLRTQEIEAQKEQLKQQADDLMLTNLTLDQRRQQIEGQKTELEIKNQEISQQRDQLEQLNQQIQTVNQLRLRFFTNISHEFRTPLTLIIDPIESLLERLKEDGQSLRTLNIINRNAQRLLHLINQLMNFRRVEEGKVEIRVTKGNLPDFIRRIYQSFLDLAEHQKIEYVFDCQGNEEQETWFDAEKLENILYNLLSNAFKYTPEKGKIKLSLDVESPTHSQHEPACFVLQVSDSGIGIAKEHQSNIFDHFYRIPVTENARIEGSGIGLALTKELIESLHGTIDLSSKTGQGTTFRVRIPYVKEAFDASQISKESKTRQFNLLTQVDLFREEITANQQRRTQDIAPAPKEDKDKPVVLIVEDNYDLRSFLVQSLHPFYRVLEAENGKEGLEMAKQYLPHLIVSDIMMPLMDGIELCSRIKTSIQTSHIPIILLTAKTMVENWVEGLETGADDYVPKPFNFKILQARIDNLIKSRERLKQIFRQEPAPNALKVTSNPLDGEFLERAYQILENHYRISAFTAEDFASKLYISRSLLYKKIKALTDMSIIDFINSFKLKKSTELLHKEDKSIAEIAFEVGFNDPKYFSRVFKKYFGMSPSDYLKHSQDDMSEQNTSSQR